jgi:methylenetetrahydrofolate reductase (NADPH)
MKISDVLNNGKVTVSCELFPPKHGSVLSGIQDVVRETIKLHPSFISITHHSGGIINSDMISLLSEIQNYGLPVLPHLTCISLDHPTVRNILSELKKNGIKNILALRGDIPHGQELTKNEQYHHASDLMKEIQDLGDFCIGGACYPEGHPESTSLEKDMESLRIKVDNGCQFLTTQMFFDNNILYNFLYRMLNHKIDVPIIAGIMPVVDSRLITRICKLSNTVLPPRFRMIIDKFSGNSSTMSQAGIAYATEQIIDLIANDIHHIHIYTMNKPDIAGRIMNNLSEILK